MDDVVEMEKESLEELEVDTNDPIEMAWKCEIDGLLEREIGTWFTAPWLTVECLMYKHIQDFTVVATATFQSTQGQPYDVFEHLKMEAMEASMVVMAEIGDQFLHGILKSPDNDASLQKLVEFSLWGNQADLSLSFEKNGSGNSSSRKSNGNRIVVNDLLAILPILKSSRKVTVVLDNAGFEHFSDLCLGDYLVSVLGAQVIFECKAFPWFVSDVVKEDFERLFQTMDKFGETTKSLAERWRDHIRSGKWIIKANPFWTTCHPYWRILDYPIFQELCLSDFLIFKGDLNYRKVFFYVHVYENPLLSNTDTYLSLSI